MRLLNTTSLRLEEYTSACIPPYAILSHTWGEDEVLYHDVQCQDSTAITKAAWNKIRCACREALKRGHQHIWIDTCCINKNNSGELQKSMNAMYDWYARAAECYVYLSDLGAECPNLDDVLQSEMESVWQRKFLRCAWWTRGWTLQELIAPRDVLFFGSAWTCIGRKDGLLHLISANTAIPSSILNASQELSTLSIAKRMSWAANRQTSHEEDRAYSLLGLLDVKMPIIYGEGLGAFTRLQAELIKTSTDQSLFAWSSRSCTSGCLLAESPDDFANDGDIVLWGRPGACGMTTQSLRMEAPILYCEDGDYREYLVLLNCQYEDKPGAYVALRLGTYDDTGEFDSRNFYIAEDEAPVARDESSGHSPGRSGRVAMVDSGFMKFADRRVVLMGAGLVEEE
ncbi:HET-domain-containing protein [Teratosphaeria destructans]|uniref:HET-domain-containing protein n=1 Tax=Teratosphaeria destructans TaxID=418781 RepID=A0A9W7SID8_9PEZI|nr:HET-domain-containing protein [Teratosphaeria destructans]